MFENRCELYAKRRWRSDDDREIGVESRHISACTASIGVINLHVPVVHEVKQTAFSGVYGQSSLGLVVFASDSVA